MSDQNKVVKFKKRKNINIGIIVFLIMFLYIAINVYIYFTKDQLSIYEVHEGSTAVNNRITGLILREEKVVYSEKAGYISYFQKEGARLAKNVAVYSIDDSGQIYDIVSNGEVQITLSEQNTAEIKHDINKFQNSFSDFNYSSVYEFKENAQSTVLDVLNSSVINQSAALLEETGVSYSYVMINSAESGIITYYTDSYETVTPESVTADIFELDKYQRTSLRTTEMVEQNVPIYKLITSETWNIVMPLSQEQYEKLSGKDRVSFTILEDDFQMSAGLKLIPQGTEYFAQLTVDKYLSNYLSDRFLEIELDFDSVEGLKIPLTSIVEKDFYLVPNEFFSMGADSTEKGLIQEVFNETTGEVTYTFVPTDIYFQDDAYSYVDTLLFPEDAWIHSAIQGSDRYQLSDMNKLTGVYNVNQGYAVFRRIEILDQNDEYCIIKKNTPYGLSSYDQIALDGTTAIEQAIIY